MQGVGCLFFALISINMGSGRWDPMKFYEKLSGLRREKGYSQEQLADLMGVSRQAVSKWEAGQAMPDLTKLIMLSDLFHVTLDELVRDQREIGKPVDFQPAPPGCIRYGGFEYKSKRTLFGWPLVHINCGCGFRVARGIIAIGDMAVGILSLGGVAAGGLALGGCSAGLLALGGLALGGLTFGGLSIGVLAFGGLAAGIYAAGGAAFAAQIAVGASAAGYTAVGEQASGVNVLLAENGLTRDMVQAFLHLHHPRLWPPLLKILSFFF